jgi:hypothetical protein
MTSFKLFGAALILSTAFASPVFAQSAGLPELPGDYAFQLIGDDSWAFLSPAPAPATPPSSALVMAVQPAQVNATKLRMATRPVKRRQDEPRRRSGD